MPSQSLSSEKECSTASGSEMEGATSGSSAAGCASEDEGPMAASRSGDMVRLPPGLQALPGTPSHGSVLHKVGTCWPCAKFWRTGGCQSGRECGYCHLCPNGKLPMHKRSKRAMLRLGLATPKVVGQNGAAADFHF